jgi:hypothetical protein
MAALDMHCIQPPRGTRSPDLGNHSPDHKPLEPLRNIRAGPEPHNIHVWMLQKSSFDFSWIHPESLGLHKILDTVFQTETKQIMLNGHCCVE